MEARGRRVEDAPRHLELTATPAAGTAMTPELELMELYTQFERRRFVSSFHRRDVHAGVLRYVAEGRDGSCILHHDFVGDEAVDEVIATQIASFQRLGKHFEWKVYGTDAPTTLGDELLRQGFRRGPSESFMVLDLGNAPATLYQSSCPHPVRRITRPSEIADAIAVQEAIAGRPLHDLAEALTTELERNRERISVYVVYADGVPVASAWLSFNSASPFAGLWGGATLPEYRRNGCYHALIAARAREARRRGISYLTIDASPMSRPIVAGLGFRFVTETWPYEWRCVRGRRAG